MSVLRTVVRFTCKYFVPPQKKCNNLHNSQTATQWNVPANVLHCALCDVIRIRECTCFYSSDCCVVSTIVPPHHAAKQACLSLVVSVAWAVFMTSQLTITSVCLRCRFQVSVLLTVYVSSAKKVRQSSYNDASPAPTKVKASAYVGLYVFKWNSIGLTNVNRSYLYSNAKVQIWQTKRT